MNYSLVAPTMNPLTWKFSTGTEDDDVTFNYCAKDARDRVIVSGFNEQDRWCEKIFGPHKWKRYYSNYYFTTENDAAMFVLRWA